jgi:hypothetical protein
LSEPDRNVNVSDSLTESPARHFETRFIEVKGQSGVRDIALTANEDKTALNLGDEIGCMS